VAPPLAEGPAADDEAAAGAEDGVAGAAGEGAGEPAARRSTWRTEHRDK
jgi:hypothetical protein